jgi:hypothetical protein
MAALIFLIVFAGLVAAAGIASVLGLTPDTRDTAFGVGPMLAPRNHGAQQTAAR